MRRDIFQAIADPTRRSIVMLLAVQAMTPNAMAEHFQTSRQAVSKHIRILVECDLLEQNQLGRTIQYHLKTDRISTHNNFEEIEMVIQMGFKEGFESSLENLEKYPKAKLQ